MLQVELANEHPAVEKNLMQTFWFSGSIAVQKCSGSVGFCRYSESLNEAPRTDISRGKERMNSACFPEKHVELYYL